MLLLGWLLRDNLSVHYQLIAVRPASMVGPQRTFRGVTDCKYMDTEKDNISVYEIGYLIASSIPEEQVPAATDKVHKVIIDSGASIITEELPRRQPLAYTMRKKNLSGSYEKYDEAYFGWTKFEVGSDKVEAMKKAIEALPEILRMLMVTTVRENTYLGKRAPSIVTRLGSEIEEKKEVAPASIEEMDKSIDEMVKEV